MRHFILTLSALFVTIAALAQPRANFPTTSVNMGRITWNHAAVATFNVINTGDKDLFIMNVHPDCGCTVVTWTHGAIPPGAAGAISITYNAEMLGRFTKGIEVSTNAFEHPVYLTVSGHVVKELEEYSGDFPFCVGDIYLNANELEFDDVHRGQYPGLAMMIYNAGDKPYAPQIMHLPKYLTATCQPEVLQPGRVGKIIFALDSEKLKYDGLTQTSIYLSRFPGDRVSTENEIKVSATLLPELYVSDVERALAPSLSIDTMVVDLRNAGFRRKARAFLTLKNTGRSSLVISALQVYDHGVNVSLGKRKIEADGSTRLKMSVHRDFANAKGTARILMITNDPKHPKVVIKLLVKKKAHE